mmetsp:Transcript_33308/g.81129  ORF Transcript_33308/g.81129 Transcript_33308/m.81129 type:complete len:308 (-) Transcript_33308:90-1013(-)
MNGHVYSCPSTGGGWPAGRAGPGACEPPEAGCSWGWVSCDEILGVGSLWGLPGTGLAVRGGTAPGGCVGVEDEKLEEDESLAAATPCIGEPVGVTFAFTIRERWVVCSTGGSVMLIEGRRGTTGLCEAGEFEITTASGTGTLAISGWGGRMSKDAAGLKTELLGVWFPWADPPPSTELPGAYPLCVSEWTLATDSDFSEWSRLLDLGVPSCCDSDSKKPDASLLLMSSLWSPSAAAVLTLSCLSLCNAASALRNTFPSSPLSGLADPLMPLSAKGDRGAELLGGWREPSGGWAAAAAAPRGWYRLLP